MKVDRLSDHPDRVKDVAQMIYNAFAHKKEHPKPIEEIMEALSPQQDDSLPITLVAIEAGEMIGTVTLFENDLTVRENYTPWLGSLVVKVAYRNKGLGKLLLDELQSLTMSLNYRVLYLRTEEAADYYRKQNWTYVETVADADFDHIDVFKKHL